MNLSNLSQATSLTAYLQQAALLTAIVVSVSDLHLALPIHVEPLRCMASGRRFRHGSVVEVALVLHSCRG